MADEPPRRATNYRRGGLAALALALLAIVVTAVRDDARAMTWLDVNDGHDGGARAVTSVSAMLAGPARQAVVSVESDGRAPRRASV